jgi:hypothetical protein
MFCWTASWCAMQCKNSTSGGLAANSGSQEVLWLRSSSGRPQRETTEFSREVVTFSVARKGEGMQRADTPARSTRWLVRAVAVAAAMCLAASTWASSLQIAPGASLSMGPSTHIDLGCATLAVAGQMDVGNGRLERAGDLSIRGSGSLSMSGGSIEVGGDWHNEGAFAPGTGTVTLSTRCGGGPVAITGTNTFNNLTLTGDAGRTFSLQAGSRTAVNGLLLLQGSDAVPIRLQSSGPQIAVVSLGPGATVVRSNVDVTSTVQIGLAALAAEVIPSAGTAGLILLVVLIVLVAQRNFSPLSRRRRVAGLSSGDC